MIKVDTHKEVIVPDLLTDHEHTVNLKTGARDGK
jgi:hypothetical protein